MTKVLRRNRQQRLSSRRAFLILATIVVILTACYVLFLSISIENRGGDIPWWHGRNRWSSRWIIISARPPPTLSEAAQYVDAVKWNDASHAQPALSLHQQLLLQSTSRRYYLHIISPYRQSGSANVQQETVMASIEVARMWAQRIRPEVQVAVVTLDDRNSSVRRPDSFIASTAAVDHTAFDHLVRAHHLNSTTSLGRRQLPLLRDVLKAAMLDPRLFSHVIYTNMDILVMPHFYAAVDSMVSCGFQSFFFNR